jgi:hypothetical protein
VGEKVVKLWRNMLHGGKVEFATVTTCAKFGISVGQFLEMLSHPM